MLAKQAWEMMHHMHSLFYWVYKARYFPRCSFFEAELGYKPSYVWRSLLSARNVILEGSRWRVRNGTKISVSSSKWLSHRPIFNGEERLSCMVSNFIDTNTWQWDRAKVYEIFAPRTRKEILATPLRRSRMRDALIWKENGRHEFTVKSAYQVALRLK